VHEHSLLLTIDSIVLREGIDLPAWCCLRIARHINMFKLGYDIKSAMHRHALIGERDEERTSEIQV